MKIKFFACVCVLLSVVGCNRSSDSKSSDTHSSSAPIPSQTPSHIVSKPEPVVNYKAQFDASDQRISAFMDQLDNPETSQTVRIQILCHDWPHVYKTEYMPALLHLKPDANTPDKLLAELKTATDYYQDAANIQCN